MTGRNDGCCSDAIFLRACQYECEAMVPNVGWQNTAAAHEIQGKKLTAHAKRDLSPYCQYFRLNQVSKCCEESVNGAQKCWRRSRGSLSLLTHLLTHSHTLVVIEQLPTIGSCSHRLPLDVPGWDDGMHETRVECLGSVTKWLTCRAPMLYHPLGL